MKLAGASLALFLAIAGLPAHGQEEAAEPAASPNPLSSLTIEGFASTLSQPLFTPSRTPPVVEEPYVEPEIVEVAPPPRVEPPPEPPPFKLVGIVMAGTEQVAIVADESTGEVHNFASGDGYDGWIMQIVDTRTVQFQNNDLNHTLTMFEEFEAPPEMAGYDEGWYEEKQYRGQSERRAYDSPVQAESGQAIDPNTGYPIDPNTGYPTDPDTGQAYDPSTGYPIDPNTGLPTDPESGIAYDPNTGYPIDPSTGEPYDPNTGFPIDPNTGEAYDPDTGQPIDPETGQPIDTGSIP